MRKEADETKKILKEIMESIGLKPGGLFLLPNGEPSYKTILLFRKVEENFKERRIIKEGEA